MSGCWPLAGHAAGRRPRAGRAFVRSRGVADGASPAVGGWPGGWWIGAEVHVVYGAHDVFCHDIVGWRRDRVPVMPRGWVDIRPDWACEVLSPGHERRDLVEKMGALHAAGVPHYWVADREERALFPYVFDPRGYLMTRAIAAGEVLRLPPFEATELRTGILFGDEDDAE